jgi:acetyl-CoA C-acetyltransferase
MTREAFIVGATRTPHGRYGGTLRDVRVVDLGGFAGAAALARSGVPADAVEETIVSNCRQAGNGPNPGRQMSLKAGVPEHVPAQTINMACASGLKAVQLAWQAISSGSDAALVVAAESMSTMPYLGSSSLRWEGVRRGDILLEDGWKDGGTDPICGMNMGQTAEKVAKMFDIDRSAQDAWALRSHSRVVRAWEEGRFAGEVTPIELGPVSLSRDETFRLDATAERLSGLKPAFVADGTVTAGNASQMSDGAAAMIVVSADAVERYGLEPQARIRAFSAIGVDPTMMGIGPTVAIPRVLEQAGLTLEDIGLFEINEAFAAQIVQNVRVLDLPEDRVNVNGGGIALGHPTGQSGSRIVVTLVHELARRGERYGVASLCVGGGQGVAAVIESMP